MDRGGEEHQQRQQQSTALDFHLWSMFSKNSITQTGKTNPNRWKPATQLIKKEHVSKSMSWVAQLRKMTDVFPFLATQSAVLAAFVVNDPCFETSLSPCGTEGKREFRADVANSVYRMELRRMLLFWCSPWALLIIHYNTAWRITPHLQLSGDIKDVN